MTVSPKPLVVIVEQDEVLFQLGKTQGVDAAATIQEHQLLTHNLRQLLLSLAGQDSFTEHDAFNLSGQVLWYVDELIRTVIRFYNTDNNRPD